MDVRCYTMEQLLSVKHGMKNATIVRRLNSVFAAWRVSDAAKHGTRRFKKRTGVETRGMEFIGIVTGYIGPQPRRGGRPRTGTRTHPERCMMRLSGRIRRKETRWDIRLYNAKHAARMARIGPLRSRVRYRSRARCELPRRTQARSARCTNRGVLGNVGTAFGTLCCEAISKSWPTSVLMDALFPCQAVMPRHSI